METYERSEVEKKGKETQMTDKGKPPGMMLAPKYKEKDAVWPSWAEPKLDGYRFWLEFDGDGDYRVVQRSGADYTDRLGFIAEQLAAAVEELYPEGVAIDGEMFTGSWNETTTLVKTEKDIDRSGLMFYAWDLIEPRKLESATGEVVDHGDETPLHERKPKLTELLDEADAGNVSRVTHAVVNDQAVLDKVYDRFLGHGFEGAMIKNPNGLYVPRRGKGWMKYKPWKTTDGQIVGFDEGLKRLTGTLGALHLRMQDGSEVEVGGGFTDKLRHEIWANRGEMIGHWVEFKHQADPKAVASYRFPIFLRFRPDLDDERGLGEK